MAITASEITTSNTIEQLRGEFNNLVTDVTGLESGTLAHTEINTTTISATTFNLNEDGTFVFEGATSNAFETTLAATDPTADRTVTLPDATGTVLLSGGVMTLTDTTEATATDAAAVIVAGGLGVAKDIWVGDDIVMDSDSAVIKFGADQDVTLTHVADLGLTLDAGANATALTLNTTESGASVAPTLNLIRASGSPADDDQLGYINFVGHDSGANQVNYGQIYTTAEDVTDGTEDGQLNFYTITAGSAVNALALTGGTATFNDNVKLASDSAVLSFGADNEITLTHVADQGLNIKQVTDADDKALILTLQTGETDIALNDYLGRIFFQAPDEAQGGDAQLVGAEISALSEGDFSSTSNATKLVFATGASETATSKMQISSAGVVALSATTEASATGTAALTVAGGIGVAKDMWLGDDLVLDSDSAVIKLGADQDVTITHVADTGLNIKQVTDADDKALILKLQTGETDIAVNDYIGRIQFQAPDEGAGTDAIAVCAEISALSEGDFAADNNATKLVFATGASEAATSKMTISSAGVVALSATTEASATGTAALTVAGGIGVAKDMWIGDDIVLDSDNAVIKFGDDQDVLLTHGHDSGLLMSVTGNNVAQFSVEQDKADASTGPVFNLYRYSDSPADGDGGGLIQFYMENDNNQSFAAAQIYATAVDVTDGTEDGKLVFNTMKAGTATTALTLSELGTATLADNLILDSDSSIIYFGDDQDVSLNHVADEGLSMAVTGNNAAVFSITMDKDDASQGPYINLQRNSDSPADNDYGPTINFNQENDNNQSFTAASIFSRAIDVSDGTEDGTLYFLTSRAGTSTAALTLAETGNATISGTVTSQSGGTAAAPAFSVTTGALGVNGMYTDAANTLGFCTAATERMEINSSGSCIHAGHVLVSADSTYDVGATATRWRQGFFDEMEIGTNTSLAASSGNACFIGYAGGGAEYGLEIKTDATTGVAVIFYHTTSTSCGSISVGSSATAFNTSSDYRLKENVVDMSGAITRLKTLKPKQFNWIVDEGNEEVDGFLAHEVDGVVPQAILGEKDETKDVGTITDADGNVVSENVLESEKEDDQTWEKTATENVYQGIDQSKLVPLLTGALQEAIAKIETLETNLSVIEVNAGLNIEGMLLDGTDGSSANAGDKVLLG